MVQHARLPPFSALRIHHGKIWNIAVWMSKNKRALCQSSLFMEMKNAHIPVEADWRQAWNPGNSKKLTSANPGILVAQAKYAEQCPATKPPTSLPKRMLSPSGCCLPAKSLALASIGLFFASSLIGQTAPLPVDPVTAPTVPAASPAPAPGLTPVLGITPAPAPIDSAPAPVIGLAVDLTSYRAALAPAVQVNVEGQSSPITLQNRDGVFDPIGVTALADGSRSPVVNVRLQFNAAQAGALASVQLLDGGDLFSADGKPATAGGAFFELDGNGGLTFVFRPPSRSDRYQVAVRLRNVETIMPVDVFAGSTTPAGPAPTPVPSPEPLPSLDPASSPAPGPIVAPLPAAGS